MPFTCTPSPISAAEINLLERVSPLLGRLTQALAGDAELIQVLHAHLAQGDIFFAELLSIHRDLHAPGATLPRIPLLLQRSDFMLDAELGPRLVECNSSAAGMAPFGERVQKLHRYLEGRWPELFLHFSQDATGHIRPNPAIENLTAAIGQAAQQVRAEHGNDGAPAFLMVVQENEDNVFDQRLLERALQCLGIRSVTRTVRQLHTQLSTWRNERLLLADFGAIDVVYLRDDAEVGHWVLKNQGEGGGHCFFDQDIIHRLEIMSEEECPAWTLMRRLRPSGRNVPTLVVRDGKGQRSDGLMIKTERERHEQDCNYRSWDSRLNGRL